MYRWFTKFFNVLQINNENPPQPTVAKSNSPASSISSSILFNLSFHAIGCLPVIASEYGDLTRGPRVINENVKKEMKKILKEIQSGKFVRDWILECKSGQLNFKAEKRIQNSKQIELVGEKLRSMMPWITSNKLVNKNKN